MERYENCFDKTKEEERMKFVLMSFVLPCDENEMNNFVQMNDYQTAKKKFIDKYISIFTKERKEQINIQFDRDNLAEYIRGKVKSVKRYLTNDEMTIVKIVLSSFLPEVADLFYINGMSGSIEDLIAYGSSLDGISNPFISSNSSTSSEHLSNSCLQTTSAPQSLIQLARQERENQNCNQDLFLPPIENVSSNENETDQSIVNQPDEANHDSMSLEDESFTRDQMPSLPETAASCVSKSNNQQNKQPIRRSKRKREETEINLQIQPQARHQRKKTKN